MANLLANLISKAFPKVNDEEIVIQEPRVAPKLLDPETLQSMLHQMDFEKIKRTMMLFDLRWIKDNGVSYMPEEGEIAQQAYQTMARAIAHGRVMGLAEVKDKGFVADYGRLNNGNELLSLKYVLCEASSLD